jgi:hypothetical protein
MALTGKPSRSFWRRCKVGVSDAVPQNLPIPVGIRNHSAPTALWSWELRREE